MNKTLATLAWDNNQVTVTGYAAFAIALARNRTLKNMTLPMGDLSASLKSKAPFFGTVAGTDPPLPLLAHEARTQKLIRDISKTLAINQSPDRVGVSKLERKQDQVLNSTQQDGQHPFQPPAPSAESEILLISSPQRSTGWFFRSSGISRKSLPRPAARPWARKTPTRSPSASRTLSATGVWPPPAPSLAPSFHACLLPTEATSWPCLARRRTGCTGSM
jgi:hypothetical protein